MAQDAEVQRRLSVEPRIPFLLADVSQRFGGATTSKSDLIIFDGAIIRRCRLFLLFLGGGKKILSSNHTYLIAAIGATLNGPCLSSVMVTIRRLDL